MSTWAIYDPNKGKFVPHYNNSKVPALYDRKSIAEEVLTRRKAAGLPWDARVVRVRLVAFE